MTGVLIKIQKNIFAITLAAAVLLGSSIAYLSSVGLKFFLQGEVAMASMPADGASRPRPAASRDRRRSLSEFESIPTGNFIRDKGTALAAGKEAGPQAEGEITLMGTLAGSASFARAAIHDSVSKKTREYRIGANVAGFKVVSIHTNSIRVEAGGNQYRIAVGEKSGQASATPAAGGATASAGGGQKIPISRQKFISLTKNPEALYKNKFAPVTRKGKIEGVKMLLVPSKDNFLYEMGARTGDIIRRINGQPLENPQKMFQLWQSAQTADKFSVEIERGGKIVPFEIVVQG